MNEKLNTLRSSSIKDKRNIIVFAEVITYLFEEIAKLITEHKPLIETYYGKFTFHSYSPVAEVRFTLICFQVPVV